MRNFTLINYSEYVSFSVVNISNTNRRYRETDLDNVVQTNRVIISAIIPLYILRVYFHVLTAAEMTNIRF